MKLFGFFFVFVWLFAANSLQSLGQAKGMDTQNQQIRDVGNNQGPTNNGNKRNTGTGRGFDFGAGRTPDRVVLANPYRMPSKRDLLLQAVEEVMREQTLVVDEAASRPADGVVVAQPFTFAKGAVLASSQLSRYAVLPASDDEKWSRARFTLRVEVQSIDGINNNVSVTAKVEGKTEGALGANWLTLDSSGEAEQDFLNALVERVTGAAPNEQTKPAQP